MWAGKAAIQVRQARNGERSPRDLGFGTQSLTIIVDDVDGHFAQAKAAGAKIVEEPHETEYGEYQYAAEDLDGHHWLFSRHVKDVRPEDWGAVTAAGLEDSDLKAEMRREWESDWAELYAEPSKLAAPAERPAQRLLFRNRGPLVCV